MYGLSHRLETGKMDHGLDLLIVKYFLHRYLVQQVRLIKLHLFSGDLFHALQRFLTGIVQVVQHDHLISGVQQLHAGMASDITGASSN